MSSARRRRRRKAAAGPRSTLHALLLLPFVVTSSCCSPCCRCVVGLRHGHEEEDQPAAGGPQPRRGDHQHRTLSCLLGAWGLFLLLLNTEPHDYEALSNGERAGGVGCEPVQTGWFTAHRPFFDSRRTNLSGATPSWRKLPLLLLALPLGGARPLLTASISANRLTRRRARVLLVEPRRVFLSR